MILLMCYKSYIHEQCLLLCSIFKRKFMPHCRRKVGEWKNARVDLKHLSKSDKYLQGICSCKFLLGANGAHSRLNFNKILKYLFMHTQVGHGHVLGHCPDTGTLCVFTYGTLWIIGWAFSSVQSFLQFRVVPGRPYWRLFWGNSDCFCEACLGSLWPHRSLPIPFLLDPAAFPRQKGWIVILTQCLSKDEPQKLKTGHFPQRRLIWSFFW